MRTHIILTILIFLPFLVYSQFGNACLADSACQFGVAPCDSKNCVCDNKSCKKFYGQDCTDAAESCWSGGICDATSKKCLSKNGNACTANTDCMANGECYKGFCKAKTGFAWDGTNSKYDVCDANCKDCFKPNDGNSCITCTDATKQAIDGICQCPTGTATGNTGCENCNPRCKSCVKPNDVGGCTECIISGMTFVSGVCSCPLSNQAFNEKTKLCETCHESCKTCSAPGDPTRCVTCTNAKYNSVVGVCAKVCTTTNEAYDDASDSCKTCATNCATCTKPGDANSCTSCATGFTLVQGNCLCQTATNVLTNGACAVGNPANPGCASPFRIMNNQCRCPDGYYGDSTSIDVKDITCTRCHYSCKTCKGDTAGQCTSCYTGFKVVNGYCVCENGGINPTKNVCEACNDRCGECSVSGYLPPSQHCITCGKLNSVMSQGVCYCAAGKSSGTGSCDEDCDATCAECTLGLKTTCTKCKSTDVNIIPVGGKCVCKEGFAFNDARTACEACHISCKGCVKPNSELHCTACVSNANLVNGICTCADGFAMDANGACMPCHESCSKCTSPNSATSCTACTDATNMSLGGGKCSCPLYWSFVNGACVACHKSCGTCSAATVDSACITCKDPSATLIGTTTKLCTCPSDMNMQDGICKCNNLLDRDTTTNKCPACPCLTCKLVNNVITCNSCGAGATANPTTNICECPQGQVLSTSFSCGLCDASCATCTAPTDATKCQTCKDGYTLAGPVPNNCVCKDGTVLENGVCVACDPSCLTCKTSKKNCVTCKGTSSVPSIDGCKCPDGYVVDPATYNCNACGIACKECTLDAPTKCISCKDVDTNLVDSACVCKNAGFIINLTTGLCVTCNPKCKTCDATIGPDFCKDCTDTTAIIDSTRGTCTCPTGKVFTTSGLCDSCDVSCATCTNAKDPKACATCPATYELKSDKSCGCPSNTFYDDVSKTCKACKNTCATCANANECLTCKDPLASLISKQCYCQQITRADGSCGVCDPSCISCSAEFDPTKCMICRDSTAVAKITPGRCTCTDTTEGININGMCEACHGTCATCELANNPNSCLTCKSPAIRVGTACGCAEGFVINSNGGCDACHITCSSCTVPGNPYYCTKCRDPNINLAAPPGLCTCPNGFTMKPDGTCNTCHPSCKTCSQANSETSCTSCNTDSGAVLEPATGKCLCVSGSFDANGACSICHQTCRTCSASNSETACVTCSDPFVTPNQDKKCICSAGMYFNPNLKSCASCSPGCKACKFGATAECTECLDGFYMDAFTKECDRCVEAMPYCLTCDSPTKCTECMAGYYVDNGVCKKYANGCLLGNGDQCDRCAKGKFVNNGTCVNCNIDNCDDCIDAKTCASCITGYYLDAGVCKVCSSGCRACSSADFCQACKPGKALSLTKRTCAGCVAGCTRCVYNYLDQLICLACETGYVRTSSGCTSCSAAIPNCVKCFNTGSCLQCDTGYFKSSGSSCSKCNSTMPNCLECKDSKTCTVCASPFVVKLSNPSECTCPQDNCETCLSNTTTCAKCKRGYFLSDTLKCTSCYESCVSCIGTAKEQCTACPENANLVVNSDGSAGECRCNNGYNFDSTTRTCVVTPIN